MVRNEIIDISNIPHKFYGFRFVKQNIIENIPEKSPFNFYALMNFIS